MAERRGAFAVALHAIRWRGTAEQQQQSTENEPPEQSAPTRELWASVAVDGAPDGAWFALDDDNAATQSVELSHDIAQQLAYAQSSRPIALSTEALTALLHAELRVAVYCGSTRSRASDELWGEARVAFMPALLGDRVYEAVCITRQTESAVDEVSMELSVECDADLAVATLGARVLHLHSLAITHLPAEWTLPSANDDEAVRLCGAPDRNLAVYELEIPLPNCGDGETEQRWETVRLNGGKLQYTPNPSPTASDDADAAVSLTGEWSIAFPEAVVHKLYLKPTIPRLVEFLQVEKHTSAVLRRTNVEAAGRVTAALSLHLHGLTTPGETRLHVDAPLKSILPLPKEALEQELAAAASNDEKKRLQALVNDYDAAIAQAATALSASVRRAKTRVVCVVDVMGKNPLVLAPPATPAPTKTIDELIPPRDLSDEYDQRKDVVADLRTEIHRVVLTVLREYEASAETENATSRDDTRQRVVFQLNAHGAYHEFKEKLKKRIVPLIRDQFADDVAPSADDMATKKQACFARVYATLMDEVQRVLHETFYAATPALETTQRQAQPRDDAAVTRTLTTLGLRALENEVNGDADKSEALHLERIAFADAQALERPAAAASMDPTLGTVWFEYATFCLGQGELDKAGGALRQSLALEPQRVSALIAYGALLCELQDWTTADVAIQNAVHQALTQETNVATAHALRAFYYSASRVDATGNLVLLELLKAQRAQPTDCASAVWIHLATAFHGLRLNSATQNALDLADASRQPRDVLTPMDRVLQRALRADVLSQRGDGDRATALLKDALEIDATHAFSWLVLGTTYLQLESQTPAAIECLERSLAYQEQLRPDERLRLFIRIGLVLLQSSQCTRAHATFLAACDEFPLASTWLGVGMASLRLERWDATETALAEANRLDPSNPEVWGYMALLALSTSPPNAHQAQQRVAQALRCELSNPSLLRELSSGFVALDRLEDAERLLRRALVLQDSSLTRKTLADVLAAQHCAEDALAQYQQTLDASTDNNSSATERHELLTKCATLLTTLGRPDEAAACRAMAAQVLEG